MAPKILVQAVVSTCFVGKKQGCRFYLPVFSTMQKELIVFFRIGLSVANGCSLTVRHAAQVRVKALPKLGD